MCTPVLVAQVFCMPSPWLYMMLPWYFFSLTQGLFFLCWLLTPERSLVTITPWCTASSVLGVQHTTYHIKLTIYHKPCNIQKLNALCFSLPSSVFPVYIRHSHQVYTDGSCAIRYTGGKCTIQRGRKITLVRNIYCTWRMLLQWVMMIFRRVVYPGC